jgi:UDP-2,3-diacylglucosamine hydrolase
MKVFIADLHLCPTKPNISSAFFWFLENLPAKTSELYLLGDIFNFWIGDDCASEFDLSIAHALKAVNDRGITLFIQTGNRDFLVGSEWCKQAGATLLPEVFNIPNTSIVVCHGDHLCTDDVGYQKFKRIRDHNITRWCYLHLPKAYRRNIDAKVRAKSKNSVNYKAPDYMDVTETGLNALYKQQPFNHLIHGHTHKLALHEQSQFQRWVLGDWGKYYSFITAEENNEGNQIVRIIQRKNQFLSINIQ